MENWTVKPNRGLGQLLFGMTQSDVSQFNDIYGAEPFVKEYGNSADDFLSNLGEFAGFFSEDVLQGAEQASREFDASTAGLIDETRVKFCYLRLEYENHLLSSITIKNDCYNLELYGDKVFEIPSRDILLKLQSMNSGALFRNDEVVFAKLGLLLSGFYYQSAGNVGKFHSVNQKPERERFFTLFSQSQL